MTAAAAVFAAVGVVLAFAWVRAARRARSLRRDLAGYRMALARRVLVTVGGEVMASLSLSTALALTDLAPDAPLIGSASCGSGAWTLRLGPAPEPEPVGGVR